MNKFLLLCVSVMAMKAEGVGDNVDLDNVSVTSANPTSAQSGVTAASIGASVDYTARFMEEQAKKIKALDNANSLEQQYRELQGVYNAFIDNTDIGDDDPKIKNVLDLVTDAQSLINSNANKDDIHRALVKLEVELRMIADAMTPLDILNRIIDKDTSSELYSKLLDRLQSDSAFTAVLKKLMPAPAAGGGAALDLTSLDTLKGRLETLRNDVQTWQVGGGSSSGIDYTGRPGDMSVTGIKSTQLTGYAIPVSTSSFYDIKLSLPITWSKEVENTPPGDRLSRMEYNITLANEGKTLSTAFYFQDNAWGLGSKVLVGDGFTLA